MKKFIAAVLFSSILLVIPAAAQSAREATVDADTKARLVLQTQLSSKLNEVGDPVRATLEEPIYVNGEMVIPQGTLIHGRITYVKAAGRPHKSGEMAIVFERMTMPWGDEPVSIVLTSADDWDNDNKVKANDEGKMNGGKQGGKTVDNVIRGGSLGGMGAGVIVLSGGSGAAGAAALGAGAVGGLVMTKGQEVRLPPGTLFRVKFAKALTLPVQRPLRSIDGFDRPTKVPNNF